MSDDAPSPDFGPGGYLPERASKRARKIVLRAPLGLQWILAAAAFGAIVLVGGLLWLNAGGPPGPPYVAVGPLAGDGPQVVHLEQVDVWLVTGVGPPMAVAGEQVEVLSWCEQSRHLESSDGRVWTSTGRGLGTPSLDTHPLLVHDGIVHVDPTTTRSGGRPAETPTSPSCTPET